MYRGYPERLCKTLSRKIKETNNRGISKLNESRDKRGGLEKGGEVTATKYKAAQEDRAAEILPRSRVKQKRIKMIKVKQAGLSYPYSVMPIRLT